MGERSEEVDSDFLSHSSLGISSAESSAHPHCADIHAINNEGKCFRHSEDIAPVLYSLHTNQEDLRSGDWRAFGPPHASSSRKSAASIEDGDENTSHFTIISNLKAIVSSAFLLQTPDRGEHRSSVEAHWNNDIYRQRWAECASEVRLSYKWIHKASVLVASFVIAELRRLLVSTMFVLLVSCVTGVVVQFAAAGLLCALQLWQHIEPFLHGLPSVRYNVLLASVRMTENHCKCCSDVLKAVEGFEERLELLGEQGDIKDLKDSVNTLQNRGQSVVSNLLQPIPWTSLGEVHKKIEEDESKIRRIQADVSEMKADRNGLRETVERVKRDLQQDMLHTNQSIAAVHAETKLLAQVLTPAMRRIMASLPIKLAKIERLGKAGQRVMELMSFSQRETKVPNTNEDHSFERNKASSSPTQNIQQSVSTEVSETSTGEENDGNELQGYPSPPGRVSNPFPIPYLNVSMFRDGQSLAADNESYVSGNFSNTFLNDGNLNQSAFDGIREIEFVGSEGNFTIMMSESGLGGCTGFATSNQSASITPSEPCDPLGDDLEKNSDEWNNNELPIENVMRVMAQQLLNLQQIFKDGEWDSRLSQLEDSSALLNANMSELHLLVSGRMALDTDAIREMQAIVANMSDIVNETLVKLEERVLTELEGRAAQNTTIQMQFGRACRVPSMRLKRSSLVLIHRLLKKTLFV
ncbi:hypothetical protein V5799_010244 [Amblyomma americanum]|uniref:Uncharacterized protein n=1 Tax=Amblyomma americanum TaxID=6943 RepID=A0AAQ4F962_AMBAM